MRRYVFLAVVGALVSLSGCDNDTLFVTDIISDRAVDGDIALTVDPQTGAQTFSVASAAATGNVVAGVDETGVEYRGFLDFSLAQPLGLPRDADVEFAFFEIFTSLVDPVDPALTNIPFLVQLVSFTPPLVADDFGAPALLEQTVPFFRSDQGQFVQIDVTELLQQAVFLGFVDFQLRLVLHPSRNVGLLQIEDTGATSTAPLLHVEYY